LVDSGANQSFAIVANNVTRSTMFWRTAHDSDVYGDDCFEMMLGAADDPAHYFHLAVNSLGTCYDANGNDVKWNVDAAINAERCSDMWVVQIAVPLERIHQAVGKSSRYKFNLFRERYAGAKPECSSWAIVERSFHEPQRFWGLELAPGK